MMDRFVGPLIILLVTAIAGALLFFYDRMQRRRHGSGNRHHSPDADAPYMDHNNNETGSDRTVSGSGGICCGMHAVCEKTTLTPIDDKIIYYDDEELDRFIGRTPESYSIEETEEFREVLMTLLPEDVAGWARSIQLRGLELPVPVRDELLMIVAELRGK